MGRIIEIEVGEKTYILEFNRRTLLRAVDIQAKVKKELPAIEQFNLLCEFIRIAFLKNHPDITQAEVDSVIDALDDFEGFIESLTKVLEESVNVLKEKKGNARWEVKN